MKVSPIIYYMNLIARIEFNPPASDKKLMEFKNKRAEALKEALKYERDYHKQTEVKSTTTF